MFPAAVLLLDLRSSPEALRRLAVRAGPLLPGPREVAIPLEDHTPEEVLAACAAAGVQVLRSRVIRSATRATHRLTEPGNGSLGGGFG